MKLSSRAALAGLATAGVLAAAAVWTGPTPVPVSAAPAGVAPLDRVPADAGLFAHVRAGDLWDHPVAAEIRKAYPKEIGGALKEIEKQTGLRPEQIETVTFHYPKLPMGPGDQVLFVLQVTTRTPYTRDTLLTGFRPKDGQATGGLIKLQDQMVLHLTSDTQFTVLHESLLDDFKKGKAATTEGVLAESLKAARSGKNALVAALDPSGLPAELFTAAPPELQPFLPLIQSRSITLVANLEKELTASVRFAAENEEKAIDAERSFNLLMKLADDGLATALADADKDLEIKALAPTLRQLEQAVKQVQAKREGTVVTVRASLKADQMLAKPVVNLFLKPQAAAARMRSSNNLKQIGLALHNYHDLHGVFPAAAIVDKKGKPLLSWRVSILPFIEQNNLYQQFKLDEPWDSEHNRKLAETVVKVYQLPEGDAKPNHTNYRVFVGNGAAFDMIQGSKLQQFTDGTSNTLLAVEAAESVPWTKPDEIEFDPKKPMKKHLRFGKNNVCNVLFGDGSVRALKDTLTEDVLKLIIQKDDGMVVPAFE